MSDLIERARKQADPEHQLFNQLADEIERLTEDLRVVRSMYDVTAKKYEDIAKLEAESIADKLKRRGYTEPKHSAYHDALAKGERHENRN